ncbi:glucodextranase DOMON-like domain-containing protein [Haloarchaeobius amylolyticus]|uniref:glucodextranase DOMON-like domain-containing protein n=1 Tax=Haloarchaeobius amylolyticus TaxID=1198296 RepID=UPI00226ED94B|nr:glucodextranase DOMON-like domain-containing protein [Haloarchaeobius amylolyticus]
MTDNDEAGRRYGGLSRRQLLQYGGVAGLGMLAGCGGNAADPTDTATDPATTAQPGTGTEDEPQQTGPPGGAYDPGPPRFMQVGELLMDPIFSDADHGLDRDNLAPTIQNPERDPENYDPDAFTWSLASKPDDSEVNLAFAPTPYSEGHEQYDSGQHNTAEFEPDVPGTYVVELAAPDGTYQQTIRVFEEQPSNAGGAPTLELSGSYDADAGEFVVDSNAALAADSNANRGDLSVEFLPTDQSSLAPADIEVDDQFRAHVPAEALDGPTRVYAAAFDGESHSLTDEVLLDPGAESVSLPNRPPDWLDDAVIYEIFTRSFAGSEGATDFAFLEAKAGYLADLGIDVVWLTPIVPAWSATIDAETDTHAPGGPHGYSTGDYFDVADDLGTLAEYRAFVDALHEHDIKVCFDLVINHCGWTHPFFQDTIAETGPDPANSWEFPQITTWNEDSTYFDWFDRMEGLSYDAAPAQTSFFGVRLQPNLNFGNVALREHILAAADFWSDIVDGFRCDVAWGVPHGFWKEVRDLVKAKDTEFFMLDETVPNDPSFAESEFDVHFDTVDFMKTAHDVARGEARPDALVEAVQHRRSEGFPGYTRLINSIENHDEPRCYYEAKENGSREDPAKVQRAAAAASFTLPGVPFIYYGQERLVSEYGTRRESVWADNASLDDDIETDPYKRAFMNWEEDGATVPQDHLQFYKSLVSFYHDSDVLGPEADLRRAWHTTDAEDDVLAFGLDAEAGKRVVLVNFGADTGEVTLRDVVATTDAFSGDDLQVDSGDGTVTVGVDTLAVFETPSLAGVGERLVGLDDESGDDHGPGTYTYPTGVPEGAFDLTGVTAFETSQSYQFKFDFAGPVENPRDREHGFSDQHLQCYLSNGKGLWGLEKARAGVGVTFPDLYQYRVVVDGEHGVRVENGLEKRTATGEVAVLPGGSILAQFPKRAIADPLSSMKIAPLVLGYDPEAEGNVMQVAADAGERTFGGDGSANSPNVVDLVTPQGVSNADALASSDSALAEVPYTPMTSSFESLASWTDPTGDDHGPGRYTYPTASDFYDGAFDLAGFSVDESRDRVRVLFEMAEPVENTWNLEHGFSHQFFQVYLRDIDAGDDQPASTQARHNVVADFTAPYQYRVVANGESTVTVEAPGDDTFGETVSTDTAAGLADEKTVFLEFPKRAVGGSVAGMAIAPLVCPYDGYGEGGLRDIAASAGEWTFGGGSDANVEPKVIDMLPSEGTSQSEALAYSDSQRATIPYLTIEADGE